MKKLNFQKVFCFISFLFLISCVIFYGTRFIKYYSIEHKKANVEKNTLAKIIKDNNNENPNFVEINGDKYFINNEENNYLTYSNILWRIIKVNADNSITAIANNSITSLAFGETTFKESFINKWLNSSEEDYSGILENNLNNPYDYLQKSISTECIIDTIDNSVCETYNVDNYITLLSTSDFANVGKNSYLVNDEYFYLENTNSEGKIWNISNNGKISTIKGTEIIGVKPVITLKINIEYIKGNGTKNNPYIIEKEPGLFASYVKIDNTLWRIYEVNNDSVKLMMDDYLKVNDINLTYKYSANNSYYNDTVKDSIAYYLNHDFLNTLSIKDKIEETTWSNGYYGTSSNYDYKESLEKTINSKVALPSIGNIIPNSNLANYLTMTGVNEKSSMIYTNRDNKKLTTKYISSTNYIIPTISIKKDLLIKGNGTIDSPFEME